MRCRYTWILLVAFLLAVIIGSIWIVCVFMQQAGSISPRIVLEFNVECNEDTIAILAPHDDLLYVTFSEDVVVWNTESGHQVAKMIGHSGTISAIALCAEQHRLASVSGTHQLVIWDTSNYSVIRSVNTRSNASAVSYSGNGKLIAYDDTTDIVLIEPDSGFEVRRLRGHQDYVWSIAFSPDSSMLATASEDGTVRVWSATDGTELGTYWESGPVLCVTFSPDGSLVSAGGKDGFVYVWHAGTGRLVSRLECEVGYVRSLCFSSERRIYAGGGNAGMFRDRPGRWVLLDIDSGAVLISAAVHGKWITSMCYSSKSGRLVSGGYEGSVKVWDVRQK